MSTSLRVYQSFKHISNRIGDALPPLVLRLILAWEFGEAGYEKLMGSNWFADVSFPFPFSLLPPEVSWQMATWFELGGAALLVLGLATRFISLSLIILTIVAIAAVHWPAEWHSLRELLTGYRIIDENGDGLGNYKLPLLYIVMFLPLLFRGAGTLSLDHLLQRRLFK
ncbi:HvfX family Cu-binding RiPP maturation protein [Methylovorus mays]|uniref:HvfX family Cu-binding RiPP maturation protein n=1 Tax=Methylovorus mays TaxID=184077 RepID=UPI001E47CB0D|nr:DoxX family protein [Methylovorus mays]MCB5206369.1 DoxX family protein [Methylovorus mays]